MIPAILIRLTAEREAGMYGCIVGIPEMTLPKTRCASGGLP